MIRTCALGLTLGLAACLAACGDGSGASSGAAPVDTAATAAKTASAAPSGTASAAPTETASAAPSAAPSAEPAASGAASATPSAVASASPSAAPAASGAAAAGAKKFDCGDKGQKACPMQGWMKSAMGSAVASGDGEKLAKALETVARKPVAGFGEWISIATAGAAKARAGDIDGAKQSCKQCHDKYKNKYQTTMRDQPW